MLDRETKRRNRYWKWGIAIVLVSAALGSAVYLIHAGNTDSWPETSCTVAGNRVVRENVADSFRAIVMYRGEYRLRYAVGGHEYDVWANSGWSDVDQQFVQDKVDSQSDRCDFRVRYNPNRPSDAVAVHK
jgi:hypothetical protein